MIATPEAIIEQAKYIFASEDFSRAFLILRDCMDESEVSNETILNLLKGKTGYKLDGNNIEFDDKFLNKEYSQEIYEILSNYDFLYDFNGVKCQVGFSFDFDLDAIADTNDWITGLKTSEGKVFERGKFPYFNEVKELCSVFGTTCFEDSRLFMYYNKKFYIFYRHDLSLIEGISTVYNEPLDAVKKYQEYQDL